VPTERVLAVDPSLRGTGYAVLELSNGKIRAVTYGVVTNPPKLSAHHCLREIHETLGRIASSHQPTTFAIEGVIYVQYAPRLVKQAVVGRGGAQKDQVAFMIRAILGLKETPPPDAADALAIGVTHFNRRATAIR
jgi:crossover junction endodeoxyribonuclease RuvC